MDSLDIECPIPSCSAPVGVPCHGPDLLDHFARTVKARAIEVGNTEDNTREGTNT